ncbi:hypothetical protein LshimejAT787_1102700 [Lyophyllum shimeji]|uniref:Uncharacterized protein n=1 Tax=Lyophyllum shimeji TaxID=47721 RepID=A0A9P3PT04_LYOSH|nr:hypothetical protein LshimejAT787_1102700 [Lyophyllum shimeji]
MSINFSTRNLSACKKRGMWSCFQNVEVYYLSHPTTTAGEITVPLLGFYQRHEVFTQHGLPARVVLHVFRVDLPPKTFVDRK